MLNKIYKHGEFGEAEAHEVAEELCELYKSRGFKVTAMGWIWEDTEPSFKTTCMCYDMKPHNLDDDGNFILTVLVEYKRAPLTEHGLLAKYTVDLHKYGLDKDGNMKELNGVLFNASGKFNGGNFETIPSDGKQLETKVGGVKVLPDSYEGNVNIKPEAYKTPDEIKLSEAGIKEGAVDTEGNLVSEN